MVRIEGENQQAMTSSHVRVRITDILLTAGPDVEDHPALLDCTAEGCAPEVILVVALSTSRSDGSNMLVDMHSFIGSVEADGPLRVKFEEDDLEFKVPAHSGDEAPVWMMHVLVICQTPHASGSPLETTSFQVVANTPVILSTYIPDKAVTSEWDEFASNCCFYDKIAKYPADNDSPLRKLAGSGKITCNELPITAPDNSQKLHPWQNDPRTAFLLTCSLSVSKAGQSQLRQCLPTAEKGAKLLDELKTKNALIKEIQKRGEEGYEGGYFLCEGKYANGCLPCPWNKVNYMLPRDYKQYCQLVPHVDRVTPCCQNPVRFQLDNCRYDPMWMLNLLKLAINVTHGFSLEDFEAKCSYYPDTVVAKVYKTALVLVTNACARYEFDANCQGKPGEWFLDLMTLLVALQQVGKTGCASGDCEDFGYFMAQWHVAFSNASELIEYYYPNAITAYDWRLLLALEKALKDYTVLPVTCSTSTESAHGETRGGNQQYQTHTCAMLFNKSTLAHWLMTDSCLNTQDPVIQDLCSYKNETTCPKPDLLEGTAMVATQRDGLVPRPNNPMSEMDQIVEEKCRCMGLDSIFAIDLNSNKNFYCWINQICIGHTVCYITEVVGEQDGKLDLMLGAPVNKILYEPERIKLVPMYGCHLTPEQIRAGEFYTKMHKFPVCSNQHSIKPFLLGGHRTCQMADFSHCSPHEPYGLVRGPCDFDKIDLPSNLRGTISCFGPVVCNFYQGCHCEPSHDSNVAPCQDSGVDIVDLDTGEHLQHAAANQTKYFKLQSERNKKYLDLVPRNGSATQGELKKVDDATEESAPVLCCREYNEETRFFHLGRKDKEGLTLYYKPEGELIQAWCHWKVSEEDMDAGNLTGIELYSKPNKELNCTHVSMRDPNVTYGTSNWKGYEKFYRINVKDNGAAGEDDAQPVQKEKVTQKQLKELKREMGFWSDSDPDDNEDISNLRRKRRPNRKNVPDTNMDGAMGEGANLMGAEGEGGMEASYTQLQMFTQFKNLLDEMKKDIYKNDPGRGQNTLLSYWNTSKTWRKLGIDVKRTPRAMTFTVANDKNNQHLHFAFTFYSSKLIHDLVRDSLLTSYTQRGTKLIRNKSPRFKFMITYGTSAPINEQQFNRFCYLLDRLEQWIGDKIQLPGPPCQNPVFEQDYEEHRIYRLAWDRSIAEPTEDTMLGHLWKKLKEHLEAKRQKIEWFAPDNPEFDSRTSIISYHKYGMKSANALELIGKHCSLFGELLYLDHCRGQDYNILLRFIQDPNKNVMLLAFTGHCRWCIKHDWKKISADGYEGPLHLSVRDPWMQSERQKLQAGVSKLNDLGREIVRRRVTKFTQITFSPDGACEQNQDTEGSCVGVSFRHALIEGVLPFGKNKTNLGPIDRNSDEGLAAAVLTSKYLRTLDPPVQKKGPRESYYPQIDRQLDQLDQLDDQLDQLDDQLDQLNRLDPYWHLNLTQDLQHSSGIRPMTRSSHNSSRLGYDAYYGTYDKDDCLQPMPATSSGASFDTSELEVELRQIEANMRTEMDKAKVMAAQAIHRAESQVKEQVKEQMQSCVNEYSVPQTFLEVEESDSDPDKGGTPEPLSPNAIKRLKEEDEQKLWRARLDRLKRFRPL